MSRVLVLVLLSGCSLFGVGRTSIGVAGATDATFGLSASVELGGGWIDTPHTLDETVKRDGEAVTFGAGGGVSTRGAEVEFAARAEYVTLTGRRGWRLGMRDGVIARQHAESLVFFDAAFGMGWATRWEPHRANYTGFELRAGPALAIVDDTASVTTHLPFQAMRFYAGVVLEHVGIRQHRYDPIDAIIGDPKGTH
jgi:hypothetical protein